MLMHSPGDNMGKENASSMTIWIVFAVMSVLFLIVLGVAPTKDYFSQWRAIQKKYNSYVKNLPEKIDPVHVGLKQRWNEAFDQINRCTTCHIGINNPALNKAPQPYTTHPEMYHDPLEYGCFTCHQGQGLATNAAEAHGESEHWDKPLLPPEYLEASCGKCHPGDKVPEAPVLSEGRQLLSQLDCAGCHLLGDRKKGSFVPALDGIGEKTSRAWLARWLQAPEAVRSATRMPDFYLSDQEVNLLTDFLMDQKKLPAGEDLHPIPDSLATRMGDQDFMAEGKVLFRQARCISCHTVEGRGGTLAPELGTIGSKVDSKWLYNFIAEPKRLQPGIPMPRYGFTAVERAAVTAYLSSELRDWSWNPDTTGHSPAPDYYDKGMELFRSYNCGGCHELSGIEGSSETGPDLTAVGDKPLFQFDFGRLDTLPRTRANFLYLKLKNPRSFRENLRMPRFTLSETELQALTTALLAQSDGSIPDKYVAKGKPSGRYDPNGPFGKILKKYSCLTCHTINGTGGTLAPDLSRAGSILQPDWVQSYFRVPYSLRPVLTERMPNLFLPDQDNEVIRQYFDLVLRDDAIDSVNVDLRDTSLVARGKELYRENSCSACHQINGKGGYVGAQLDEAGDRLTPGWVYHWLQNPQRYVPATPEPAHDLGRQQLEALTAYIMSLKRDQQ